MVIHLMGERRAMDHRLRDEGKYICISHRYLHRFLSKERTTAVLKDLLDWEILETDQKHWNGPDPKAYGYRLTEPYRASDLVRVPFIDKRLMDKVAGALGESQVDEEVAHLPGYRECLRWVSQIAIDRSMAEQFIARTYPERTSQYRHRMDAINRIAEGRIWFRIGKNSNRAFHTLSGLEKDLRPFLSVAGQPLQQVDIGCSQPLFLYLLLRRGANIPNAEEQDMHFLLVSGDPYEVLDPGHIGRERTKTRFYREVLFRKTKRTTKVAKRFAERFPTYSNEIHRLHEEARNCTGPSLAALLQRTEAEVVFEAVHRFAERTGDAVPIMTIHDSLVTTADHLDLAKEVLEEVFMERYSIKPILHIK